MTHRSVPSRWLAGTLAFLLTWWQCVPPAVAQASAHPTPAPADPSKPNPASCQLYPIALSQTTVAQATVGRPLPDVLDGTQPGNFGWLTWTGNPSAPTLAKSLTPPGDSVTYINPLHPADHVVSVGDGVSGAPGTKNSQAVRTALTGLKTNTITVPV